MAHNGFNLFDECAVRYIYLSPKAKDCASFYWKDSKMYTAASIPNSQKISSDINKTGAIAKVRTL